MENEASIQRNLLDLTGNGERRTDVYRALDRQCSWDALQAVQRAGSLNDER